MEKQIWEKEIQPIDLHKVREMERGYAISCNEFTI